MAERNCVGILYSYDSNWIGGSYYIQNLIAALKSLPESEMPFLKIICRKPEDFDSVAAVAYPHAKIFTLKYSLPYRILNKFTAIFFGTGLIDWYYLHDLAYIFPASFLMSFPPYFKSKIDKFKQIKKVFWIPDFQERYYPEFFEASDIERRDGLYKQIASSPTRLILSSYAGLEDFKKFYAGFKCDVKVVHFAVTHPAIDLSQYAQIKNLYNLPDSFYFVPNQFWKHKNHMVVLNAMLKLKDLGHGIQVVFSGKESDYRNPDYFPGIKRFVTDYNLTEQCHFLGFIPRSDQLLIMKNSRAVIQPSLFEGWSTVVEDAKALNVFLLLSAISTHQEQVETNGLFFEATNDDALVDKILYFERNLFDITKPGFYHANVLKFAHDFIEVLQ